MKLKGSTNSRRGARNRNLASDITSPEIRETHYGSSIYLLAIIALVAAYVYNNKSNDIGHSTQSYLDPHDALSHWVCMQKHSIPEHVPESVPIAVKHPIFHNGETLKFPCLKGVLSTMNSREKKKILQTGLKILRLCCRIFVRPFIHTGQLFQI